MKKSEIKKILIVSLTNIGDVVLTCPVIDAVINRFPLAEISLIVGPKAQTLFERNPYIKKIHIFTKNESFGELVAWVRKLRQERFDAVIDLRNTALGYFLGVPFHTSVFFKVDNYLHKRDQHWQRFQSILPDAERTKRRYAIFTDETIRKKAENALRLTLEYGKGYCVVAAGAADRKKRWTSDGFADVCQALIQEYKLPLFFVGDILDQEHTENIAQRLPEGAANLCGKLSLLETTWVLRNSRFVLCNDSAAMHLASYFDVPVVALFGPTDPRKYGPWGDRSCFVRAKKINEAGEGTMASIDPQEVLVRLKELMAL